MPSTRSGVLVAEASEVTDKEEVLVARIASGQMISNVSNSRRLSAESSLAASITKSAPAERGLVNGNRDGVEGPLSLLGGEFALEDGDVQPLPQAGREFLQSLWDGTSWILTEESRAWAQSWAMPEPMVPAPTTAMRWIIPG